MNAMRDDNARAANTILLVDSEPADRYRISGILEAQYTVLQAGDGIRALELLRENPEIAAVVLDPAIPGLDGYDVISAMRGDPALRQIPVVVLAAGGDDDKQLRALESGALDVIARPFRPEIVKRRLRNLIERRASDGLAAECRAYERLMMQAEIDEKTGVYTREAFCRKTAELMRAHSQARWVICRWDIDRFKVYNDMFGIEAGDALMMRIGRFCREDAADGPRIVGHLEADHFVCCFEADHFSSQRFVDRLEAFISAQNCDFGFIVRVGAYRVDDPTLDVSLMCDRALLALRSTKGSYSQRIAWYDASMRDMLFEEQSFFGDVDSALSSGQFVVYLQPQYNYETHALTSAEALVRWRHPTRGLIQPDRFIPLFERNGFIWRMDEYVWEQVCILLRKWIDAGTPLVPISINISRHDIFGTHPGDIIQSLLAKYSLDPSLLRLEVTESAFVQDLAKLVEMVDEFKSKGFRVEMDDFGSGYSSLNTLKEVHVDTLKMDMKFLESGKDDARAGQILSSIIRMANWLDLPVIAEGVETKAQADYLKSLGCLHMQGFYFARPMPMDEFEALLAVSQTDVDLRAVSENKVEGSIDFLNASTQATLMFNSFVGGAQIVELHGDNVETLRVNNQFFRITGINREEYADTQKHLQDRFYPESRETLLETLRRAAETGEEEACELHSLPARADGADLWTQVRVRHLVSNANRKVFYLSVDNVTERRELDRMRVQLNDMVENLPVGIGIFELRDDQLYPQFVSDRALEILGFTREDCDARTGRGQPFFPALSAREILNSEGDAGERETTRRVSRGDGREIWLNAVCSVVRRADANPLVYATLRDVSAQRQAHSQAAALMPARPGGATVFRVRGGQLAREYVGEDAARLYGCATDALLGTDMYSRVHPQDRPRVKRAVIRAVAARAPLNACYRARRADDSYVWVSLTGNPAADSDGVLRFYCVYTDLSERLRASARDGRFAARAGNASDQTDACAGSDGRVTLRITKAR